MNKTEKILGMGVLIAIVIALAAFSHSSNSAKAPLGAVAPTDITATNYTELTASNGLAVGTSQQFQVDSSGIITTSGALTSTGVSIFSTLTQGGGQLSTSTSNSTETLTAANVATADVINETPNVASLTLSLPASSTLSSVLTNVGDYRDFFIVNSTTTAGITLTIAGNTGVMLQKATSSAVIQPGKTGQIRLIRATSTRDIVAQYNGFN